jgi:hypothetical protein
MPKSIYNFLSKTQNRGLRAGMDLAILTGLDTMELEMSDEPPKRGPGRPRLPEDQRARVTTLSASVREDYGQAIRAEAARRGVSNSQLVRSFIDAGMGALSEEQAA